MIELGRALGGVRRLKQGRSSVRYQEVWPGQEDSHRAQMKEEESQARGDGPLRFPRLKEQMKRRIRSRTDKLSRESEAGVTRYWTFIQCSFRTSTLSAVGQGHDRAGRGVCWYCRLEEAFGNRDAV